MLKNQNSHTINLTEIEKKYSHLCYALKRINTGFALNYTIVGSVLDELKEQTKLFQFWSNSCINSQFKSDKFNKIEFYVIIAQGSISGYLILALFKKHNFTSKSNHLSGFFQKPGIKYNNQEEEMENVQAIKKLEILIINIITKSCHNK